MVSFGSKERIKEPKLVYTAINRTKHSVSSLFAFVCIEVNFKLKQEISLKKIFGGSQILIILTQQCFHIVFGGNLENGHHFEIFCWLTGFLRASPKKPLAANH